MDSDPKDLSQVDMTERLEQAKASYDYIHQEFDKVNYVPKDYFKGVNVIDPTRTFLLTPPEVDIEPPKPLKWYQKVYLAVYSFFDSMFFMYLVVAVLRLIQVGCIVFLIRWLYHCGY